MARPKPVKRVVSIKSIKRKLSPELVSHLEKQADVLEQCAEILSYVQAMVPLPTAAEIEEIRGGRAMTRDEYMLGRLQRVIVSVENAMSDIRVDLEYKFEPGGVDLLQVDINALLAAVERVTS
jgi:hypothetical protein